MAVFCLFLSKFSLLNSHFCEAGPSTTVERTLQIRPFMQNKANFRKSQMNVNKVLTKNYEQMDTWSSGKNKANTKPIQTQYKANTNPIQSQYKPNTKPNKPNFRGKK